MQKVATIANGECVNRTDMNRSFSRIDALQVPEMCLSGHPAMFLCRLRVFLTLQSRKRSYWLGHQET